MGVTAMNKLYQLVLGFFLFISISVAANAANAVLLGWNNLGMHCMDSRYGEFAILPPYNTVEAQLIVNGNLVTKNTVPSSDDFSVTYEAVADPTGSVNSSSVNKSDWIKFAPVLFGLPSDALPSADFGLAHCNMPGVDQPYDTVNGNRPQEMPFQPDLSPIPVPKLTFHAEGIPITPEDDSGNKNTYPMMKLVARQKSTGAVVAESKVVLPVSDEMSCKNCHAADSNPNAKPARGWDKVPGNLDREYRLNVLKLHDEKAFADDADFYIAALKSVNIETQGLNNGGGLYEQVIDSANPKKPVLCAACHQSEALGAPSFTDGNKTVIALTAAIHTKHAEVSSPNGTLLLNDSNNRTACYECHPGSETRCLRGAMGSSVASDGSMEMQCQSCHGNMHQVGSTERTGWFDEPTCQSCHTGTATRNNGKIRYTSVFDEATGKPRIAADLTFATNSNSPVAGLSLYRFSAGHGDLQCEACHGSTHAIFPTSHANDNVRNIELQGHAGTMAECSTCHDKQFDSESSLQNSKGPHGLHPMNGMWAEKHHDAISSYGGLNNCKTCHGSDLRGTELSRVQGDRRFNLGSEHGGVVQFYRGGTVGCYSCHNGTSTSAANNQPAPVTQDISTEVVSGDSVEIALPIDNTTNLTFRVLKQPAHGRVGIQGTTATYFADQGYAGRDEFTFAGYNGVKNTNTGSEVRAAKATINVSQLAPAISSQPMSQTVVAGSDVTFTVVATGGNLSYQWKQNETDIAGATGPTLTVPNVLASLSGSTYSVVVSNDNGFVESGHATLTVTKAASSTSLTATPSSATTYGVPLIFTATVKGVNPSEGTVTFMDQATPLASEIACAPNGNTCQAIFTTATFLEAGSHSITAKYSGGANNQPSNAGLTQVVNKAVTSAEVTSALNPSMTDQPVMFNASLTGGGNYSGTVRFMDGGTTLGTASVAADGSASLSTSSLTEGQHTITITYPGDANNTASTSAPLTQTVQAPTVLAKTTTNITSSRNPSRVGRNVTFTARISGGRNPAGTVCFFNDGNQLSCSSVSRSRASYTTNKLTKGSHSISAHYSGDSKNAASDGDLIQVVN
jgi:hypothetical protein